MYDTFKLIEGAFSKMFPFFSVETKVNSRHHRFCKEDFYGHIKHDRHTKTINIFVVCVCTTL